MAENERLGASFSIDVTNLKAGLTQANRLIRESESEFKAAAAGMDDWTKSEEGLNSKIKSLSSIIGVQKEKVSALKKEYERLISGGLDPASREAVQLRTKINQEEAALRSNEKELKNQSKALKDLGKNTEEAGKGYEKLGDMAKTAGKVAAAAMAAAAAAVGALAKQAIESFAEYEQLVGGVDTLFGASSKKVQDYANNAYKTAGMSANEYMEQVTSFSASLLQGLGGDTEKAAEVADLAVTDMADNANKMGTSMELIQNAYNGFAKGNFTMLDNLKLGYGGTQAEMVRLMNDSGILENQITSMDGITFDQMIAAIHAVQTNLGITGTTAKEASSTIQGSIASMQGAWANLLTGLADDTQDIDQLITNLIDSISAVAENLLPRISVVLEGVVKLISRLLPQIPPLLAELLPQLMDSVMGLIQGLVDAIPLIVSTIVAVTPQILTAIVNMLPSILSAVLMIITSVINGVAEMLPDIISAIMDIIPQLVDAIVNAFPLLLDAFINLLMAIVEAIPIIITKLVDALPAILDTIIGAILQAIPLIIEAAIQLFMAILDALPVIINALVQNLPIIVNTIINGLLDALPLLLEGAITLLMAIVDALPTIITLLTQETPKIVRTIVATLLSRLPDIIKGAVQLFMGIIQAIPQIIAELVRNMPQIIKAIINGLKEGFSSVKEIGGELIKGLWEGIKNMAGWIGEKIKGFGEGILNGLKDFFGIHSPSKVMSDQIGKNLALGIGKGFEKNIGAVNDEITSAMRLTPSVGVKNGGAGGGAGVTIYQTNNYSQAHSRLELYKSKQQTAAAVRLAMGAV